jgi:thiol-disulfide isomerase/thioredoxin
MLIAWLPGVAGARKPSGATGAERSFARSVIGQKAPDLGIERWVGAEPNRAGKFLLVDLWSTTCEPCRKLVPKLNDWHRRFSDRLAIVGITYETEPVLRRFSAVAKRSGIPPMEYSVAIDTRRTLLNDLKVTGIPYVLIIDPAGVVRWEGFPLQSGRELTESVLLGLIGDK